MSDGRGRKAGFVRKAGGRWAARAAAVLLAAAPLAAAAQEEAREEKAELVFTTDVALAPHLPEARARALEYVRTIGDLERDQDGRGNTAMHYVEARGGPGEEYERSARLGAGEKVRVTGASGAWRWVETAGGRRGFVLASALEEGPQWEAGAVFRDCPECPEMVVVPAGEFMMGSPPSEEDRRDSEGPVHRVTIAEPFAAGKYEVTFEEWDACVGGGGCGGYRPDDEGWGRGSRPVINVSWEDAQAYAAWLSGKTGENYRLLSEAEWEYAARAGTTTRYHWGDDIGRNRANCDDDVCGDSWDYTAPVGSFAANGFGLHDVHGNVWEWVEDCWNDSYAGAPTDGSAWESGNCDLRVLRGGSWHGVPRDLRAAYRFWGGTGIRLGIIGFRVARTLAR